MEALSSNTVFRKGPYWNLS